MNTISIDAINAKFNSPKDFFDEDEKYLSRIKNIGDKIADEREVKPIVLISGPSGSGKTTTARLLDDYLLKIGVNALTFSLDNYFTTVDHNDKTIDFESPSRINSKLLGENIAKLLAFEEFVPPYFDFNTDTSKISDVKVKRQKGDVIIFEGTHALNPSVIGLGYSNCAKIYVNVDTEIKCGDLLLKSEHIRLMRRALRDKLFRARSVEETLSLFESVEKGTVKYLAPYLKNADCLLDSFISYEPTIYKFTLEEQLKRLDSNDDTVKLLSEFLGKIKGNSIDFVPENSLVREFVGSDKIKDAAKVFFATP